MKLKELEQLEKNPFLKSLDQPNLLGEANLEDLLKVEGINKSSAKKIFNFFNE